jgi:hypothetical protein
VRNARVATFHPYGHRSLFESRRQKRETATVAVGTVNATPKR